MANIPFLSLKDVTALHGAEINEAVTRVVNNGWYLQGKENETFEQHYSEFIGCKHTIGCANGLDALIWIFRAYIEMGVMQPGDEVIVPANTYIATILAITENNNDHLIQFIEALEKGMPSHVSIKSLTVNNGSVNLTATTSTKQTVAKFITQLSAMPGISNVYVPSVTESTDAYGVITSTFSASFTFNTDIDQYTKDVVTSEDGEKAEEEVE